MSKNNYPTIFSTDNANQKVVESGYVGYNGMFDLGSNPDEWVGVKIWLLDNNGDRTSDVFVEKKDLSELGLYEFRVDYTNAYIYTNSTWIQRKFDAEFYSKGFFKIPATRVCYVNEDGKVDISKTLNDYIQDIISNTTFTQASVKENIVSGEGLPTMLGKISKWLSDLKGLAFKDKISHDDIDTGAVTPTKLLPPVTTGGNGSTYTVSVDGITELYNGLVVGIIPHIQSNNSQPYLNVNDLGNKRIKRGQSTATNYTGTGYHTGWIKIGCPLYVMFNSTLDCWILLNYTQTLMDDVPNLNDALDNKVDKITGKGLSTNDYTNEDKEKLDLFEYQEENPKSITIDKDTILFASDLHTGYFGVDFIECESIFNGEPVNGRNLSTNDYTDEDKSKVGLIGNNILGSNTITQSIIDLDGKKINYEVVEQLPTKNVYEDALYLLETYKPDYDPIDNPSGIGYDVYIARDDGVGEVVWCKIGSDKDIIGDLADLNTSNKSTIVSAINEIRSTGGACVQAQRYYDLGELTGTITDGILTVVYNGDLLDLSTRTKIDFVIDVDDTWTKTAINLVANDMTLTLENSNGNQNIGSNDIAVTRQVTIYVDDTRYIDGDPVPTYSLKNNGGGGTDVTFNGDLSGNEISQTVVGINGISTDVQSIANGQLLGYNSDTNKIIPVDINVSGIVGNSVIKQAGSDVVLESGGEATFHHTQAEHKVIDVYEVVDSDTIVDSTIDFGDSEKYLQQDVEVKNGAVKMKTGGIDDDVVLMLEFDNNLTDKSPIPKNIATVAGGVTYSSTDKKVGTHSAYFNKSTVLRTNVDTKFNINESDFTIEFWGKFNTDCENGMVLVSPNYRALTGAAEGGFAIAFMAAPYNYIYFSTAPGQGINTGVNSILPNTWSFFRLIRAGNSLKLCLDGVVKLDTTYIPIIGLVDQYYISNTQFQLSGYIDNLRVIRRATDPYEVPVSPYSRYLTNVNGNVATSGANNLSIVDIEKFVSIDIPYTKPTNTDIKCLVSFNNRQSWHWYDGAEWVAYTNNLSENWTNSNTPDEIVDYFDNLTKSQLINDLSIKGIYPFSIDFAFQLSTTDSTTTPAIESITITYETMEHLEKAWCGNLHDASSFGVMIVDDTSFTVKNKTASPRKIKTYITTAESE